MKKLFLIPLISFALLSCGEKEKIQAVKEGQIAEDVYMYEAYKGDLKWILESEQSIMQENVAYLTNPIVKFYENKEVSSTFRAVEGEFYFAKNLIVLKNNVRIHSFKDNTKVRTTILNYNLEDEFIWTDENVYITRGDGNIKGTSLKAKADLSEIEIENQESYVPKSAEQDFNL
ncbi:MAG: LPS export ABC transporter periplasmic protein LptC [Elusimicrobiaceae bacterium]|jgi:LPS export ABC transporter protein LptC|nr:LPS export ABC transporter periplasmic protein LptC [Elusimicrobiaceae bacterium]MBT4008502.1 LPS export ABC transporter periplasmic protein LptC [Elusimicrobiaceae bacterium]MBT4403390.1 LPS export ABC transporter periplasmic protein LptC [Elusimicrobiaceae bacterium]MBT4440231.1 LPS export ABC transporter periplasmic protein LptC [Elusimicrobiaceae bacterium]MBT5987655.1 LPS export ABC transporter periplasmic protein LptC [Elusimicrobiaceae bacterium]